MKHWLFKAYLLSTVLALSGCFVIERTIGPPPRSESAWVKLGFDEEMVASELLHCGQLTSRESAKNRITDDEGLSAYDMCMLHKGFRYVDSPRPLSQPGYCQRMGQRANTDNRPKCQALRGDLKVVPNNPVTPEQAAIRMIEEGPTPFGEPVFIFKCLYSLTCYNALERAEPGRVQKVIDALPDDIRTRFLTGRYYITLPKNNRSPLAPKQ